MSHRPLISRRARPSQTPQREVIYVPDSDDETLPTVTHPISHEVHEVEYSEDEAQAASDQLPFDESALQRAHEALYDIRHQSSVLPARPVSPFLTHSQSSDDTLYSDDSYNTQVFHQRHLKPDKRRAPSPPQDHSFGFDERGPPTPSPPLAAPLPVSTAPSKVISKDNPRNTYNTPKRPQGQPRNLKERSTASSTVPHRVYPYFFTDDVIRSALFKRLIPNPSALQELASRFPFPPVNQPILSDQDVPLSSEEKSLPPGQRREIVRNKAKAHLHQQNLQQTLIAEEWLQKVDTALHPPTIPHSNAFLSPSTLFGDLATPPTNDSLELPAHIMTDQEAAEQLDALKSTDLNTLSKQLGLNLTPLPPTPQYDNQQEPPKEAYIPIPLRAPEQIRHKRVRRSQLSIHSPEPDVSAQPAPVVMEQVTEEDAFLFAHGTLDIGGPPDEPAEERPNGRSGIDLADIDTFSMDDPRHPNLFTFSQ